MARTTGVKREQSVQELPVVAPPTDTGSTEEIPQSVDPPQPVATPEPVVDAQPPEPVVDAQPPEPVADVQDIDTCLNALKTLLSTVEKLQKVRQEIGDIKPLLVRMLDGEVMSGEELEQLKTGVGGLLRLVRAYSDHQSALVNAQPARDLLDQVLKGSGTSH